MTFNIQSESLISEYRSYAFLKFAYDISFWGKKLQHSFKALLPSSLQSNKFAQQEMATELNTAFLD